LSISRRHHFLAQCYLKGFAPDRADAQLFVVDAKEKKSFTTSPLNVANERDFHPIPLVPKPAQRKQRSLARRAAISKARGRPTATPS